MLPHLDPSAFELSVEQRLMLEKIRRELPHMPRRELEELAYKASVLCEARQAMIKFLITDVFGGVSGDKH